MSITRQIWILCFVTNLIQKINCQIIFTYPFQDKIHIQDSWMGNSDHSVTVLFNLNCQNRKLLISNIQLDLVQNQPGFIIEKQENDNSVTFKSNNHYFVRFTVAEICIDTFFVGIFEINQIQLDGQQKFSYNIKNPPNFNKNMLAFPYIIGVLYGNQYQQCVFIKNTETLDDGFNFNFQSCQDVVIEKLIINYIYYDPSSNPYYQIIQFNDDEFLNQNIIPAAPGTKTFKFQDLQDIYNCASQNFYLCLMNGLTGYKQNLVNHNLRQTIICKEIQPNQIQISYQTWADSVIQGISSQLLLFQMKVCENGQANYQDQCQDCPQGWFLSKDDQRNVNICLQCDDTCLTCVQKPNQCILCSISYPYFISDQNICQQNYPKQYYCDQNQNRQSYVCTKCINCPSECSGIEQCCNKTQYKFNQNNQSCGCYDDQTMIYNPQPQKCQCIDEITMAFYPQSCLCVDTLSMKYSKDKSKCECLDQETMIFQNDKCICREQLKMTFNKEQSKCLCNETMKFNSSSQKCDCLDSDVMDYNQLNKICECPSQMLFDNTLNLCICSDSTYYLNPTQKICLKNPSDQNCQILEKFLPSCQKCMSGFLMKQGRCIFCGNGKFFDEKTNSCCENCQDFCFLCSDKLTCQQFDEEFPCHFSCQLCQIPNSPKGCNICSSKTRIFNPSDNTCLCKYGYEEVNKTDCIQIEQSYSQSFLHFKDALQNISYYLQLFQVIIPVYPHIQYSFMLQQQIGIISQYLPKNAYNLRIELLNGYNNYNFKLFGERQLIKSDNQSSQTQINYLFIINILLSILLLFKLLDSVIKNKQSIFWFLQDQLFIIASRLISIFAMFSIVSIFNQLSQLDQISKELVLSSINLAIIILYNFIQIKCTIEIYNKKQNDNLTNRISKDSVEILQNDKNYIYSSSNLIIKNDINSENSQNYFIWTICELRKIVTIILLQQIQVKTNFYVLGGVQIAFGLILLLKIFDNNLKQFYCISSEIFLVCIYFLTASSDNNYPESTQVGLQYAKPSILDVIISSVSCTYHYYELIKKIIQTTFKKKEQDQVTSLSLQQFPQEFSAGTIQQILNTDKSSFSFKNKGILKSGK